MATPLYVETSPRKQRSASIEVARAFIDAYRQLHPADSIQEIHVWNLNLPEFAPLHQSIEIELLPIDRMMGLARERIDIALRWPGTPAPGLSAAPAADIEWGLRRHRPIWPPMAFRSSRKTWPATPA